jgi:hypothetical protein
MKIHYNFFTNQQGKIRLLLSRFLLHPEKVKIAIFAKSQK